MTGTRGPGLQRLLHRRREKPALDQVLAAERTSMAWQRTGLAVGGFSAMLVHLGEHSVLSAAPGLMGMLLAAGLLVVAERRYSWVLRCIENDVTCAAPRTVAGLTLAVTTLAISTAGLVALVAT